MDPSRSNETVDVDDMKMLTHKPMMPSVIATSTIVKLIRYNHSAHNDIASKAKPTYRWSVTFLSPQNSLSIRWFPSQVDSQNAEVGSLPSNVGGFACCSMFLWYLADYSSWTWVWRNWARGCLHQNSYLKDSLSDWSGGRSWERNSQKSVTTMRHDCCGSKSSLEQS